MSFRRLILALGFVFVLAAGITWVAGEPGEGPEGRITVADVAGLGLFGLWFIRGMSGPGLRLELPIEYRAYLPLLFVYAVGVLFSQHPARGALELLVHGFIFAVSLVAFNLYRHLPAEEAARSVLVSILWAGGLLALIGLVDFFVWDALIPGSANGLVGTFRNTGQAGAFFGMYLATLIPAFLSGVVPVSFLRMLLLVSIGVALVFTAKRAAMLGLTVGAILLALKLCFSSRRRDKALGSAFLAVIGLLAPLVYFLLIWGLENIPGMTWRFNKKFNENTAADFEEGFLADNLAATEIALDASPLIGVGLGNVAGIIMKHEIHSTYLAVLGQAGLLGALAYCYFIVAHGWQAVGASRRNNVFADYLRYYVPLFCGLLVSWAYTYHLRKREFWIVLLATSLVSCAARSSTETEETRKG